MVYKAIGLDKSIRREYVVVRNKGFEPDCLDSNPRQALRSSATLDKSIKFCVSFFSNLQN